MHSHNTSSKKPVWLQSLLSLQTRSMHSATWSFWETDLVLKSFPGCPQLNSHDSWCCHFRDMGQVPLPRLPLCPGNSSHSAKERELSTVVTLRMKISPLHVNVFRVIIVAENRLPLSPLMLENLRQLWIQCSERFPSSPTGCFASLTVRTVTSHSVFDLTWELKEFFKMEFLSL